LIYVGCIQGLRLTASWIDRPIVIDPGWQTDFSDRLTCQTDLGTALGEHPRALDAVAVDPRGQAPYRGTAALPPTATDLHVAYKYPLPPTTI
jgi:hypothetical protein